MTNSADFESFLKDINPSKSTIDEASRLHRNLRDHLKASETYGAICKDTYLSGSYAKQTFIRPKKDSDSCDIDIIVETNHSINDSPFCVLLELEDAIRERECYKNVRVQTHSIGIDMANFHLDVVPLVKDEDGLLYIGSKTDGVTQSSIDNPASGRLSAIIFSRVMPFGNFTQLGQFSLLHHFIIFTRGL